MLEIKEAVRKPFPIRYEQVTLENIEEVAAWCKGTVEKREQRMLGTTVSLPVIKVRGQGDQRNKFFDAALGCYVVELKGSFRVYKPQQFEASFDVVPSNETLLKLAEEAVMSTSEAYKAMGLEQNVYDLAEANRDLEDKAHADQAVGE